MSKRIDAAAWEISAVDYPNYAPDPEIAAKVLAAADAVMFSDEAVERAYEAGMASHDWQMFECPEIPGGMDAAEAVAEAIRAVIASLKDG